MEAGVSAPVGNRWFRSSGGMPPTHLSPSAIPLRNRSLTFREREEIALECARGTGIRAIARNWDDHRARSRARSDAIQRHAAATSTIEPLLHSGMLIERLDGRRWRNLQPMLPFATASRTDSLASLPHPTASPSMARSWYGKDAGPFIGKADAGPKPGARNRLRGV